MKLLVIDAMRKTLSASTGAFVDVAEARHAGMGELAVDDDAPGRAGDVVCAMKPWKRRSTSANAAASFARSGCCAPDGAASTTITNGENGAAGSAHGG